MKKTTRWGIWITAVLPLLAAAFAVSEQWFWIPFLMFLVSLSGWAGKFVAIAVVLGQPAGSYLQDNGGSIKVYTPAEV